MSLFFAELRKIWGGRVFPVLLAILASANLLLLWMGTRPTAKQPPASAYRVVGAELTGKTMEEKGSYLHDKYTEIESLVKIGQYYREMALRCYGLSQYRQDNAAMFDAYEQEYNDKSYTLFTDDLNIEYRLFSQLQSEYDTVAAYNDFLEGVQTKATQLSGISIFQNDRTGYDLKNIELTAQVYAGLADTPIEYYPQKGLYTAISYAFTDLILLAAMLLLALCFSGLFAMERKGGMDEILTCTPLGRKYTVKAKLRQSTAVAAVISFGTVLPHLWQVLRDYGLPSLLGPAMSISDLQAVPKFITLSDLLIFWLICRFAACLCMSRITLWLGQKLGNLLTALFISVVAYCLPALLSLSGMKNGIEWLGFYPLFHAAALWQNQAITPTEKATTQCGFRFFWYAQHSFSHGQSDRLLWMTMI